MKRRAIKKKNLLIASFLLIVVIALMVTLLPKEPLAKIKMGVVRGEKSEEEYQVLASSLQEYLTSNYNEVEVSIHYYESDKMVLSAMAENGVQIAFTSGVGQALYGSDDKSVIAAENVIEYQGKMYPYYTSVLLKREYEGYDEFLNQEDVSTLQYCVLSSNSLAGNVFVRPYFEENGLHFKDMENVTRVSDYTQGIEYLSSGTCDASVGYLGSLEDYREMWTVLDETHRDIEEDLRVIYVSDKLYSSAVSISKEVQGRNDLKQTILAFLLENNYSTSHFDDYTIIKERIQTTLGGKSNE